MLYSLSLIFIFTIITNFDIIYASKATEGSISINWFQIGIQYIDTPAVGWCMLTFIMFSVIVFSLLYFYLLNLINFRYKEIKKISLNSRKNKSILNVRLLHHKKKTKSLKNIIKKSILKTYKKIKIDQTKNRLETIMFFVQLNNSFIDIINNHILLLRNIIKNNFVKKVIKKVIQHHKNNIKNHFTITDDFAKQFKNIFYTYCKGK